MSQVNKVLVTGSSGYVANYIMKQLATSYPHLQVVGMSRSGKAREDYMRSLKNVKYFQGNCLHPETFKEQLQDVDAIIHTVGTLIQK